ncbi:MAG: hypothetical protein WC375_03400 [Methanomassiliicoccales archaeon]|jgi:calcineurin-like phosphoesterase family protein
MMNIANTYWRADDHFGHKNILHLCNRPFQTIDEWAHVSITNHNSVVSDACTVWYMGDFAYKCSSEYTVECLRQLNGQIRIILGNHDKPLRQAVQRGLIQDLIRKDKVIIVGSLDQNISTSLSISIDGQDFFMSHYAHRTWPGAFRGTIHLYAHSHNNLASLYKSFDTGVDANHYFPISGTQIMAKASLVTKEFTE